MSEDLFDGDIQAINRNLLEIRDIQDPCVEWARRRGWWARKFASPNNRSVMDYIFGKDTWVELVEFKAPKKKLSKAQGEEHKAARACGMRPVVFDNVAAFKAYILAAEGSIDSGQWDQEKESRTYMARGHEQGPDL